MEFFCVFFMSMQHRRNKKCIKILYQPGRDLPLIPKRLLYKRGLWQNHGLFHWAHASLHISAASWLAGNISGEDVKNRPPPPQPPPPKPFWQAEIADTYTPRLECDRALFGRSCGKEGAPWSSSAKSAPLSSYYLWKLNNLPCKQNGTANVYSAEPAPRRHEEKKKT